MASEQYLWDAHSILAAIQTPHPPASADVPSMRNAEEDETLRFSVVFIDRAFAHSAHYAELLGKQSTVRSQYEAIIVDAYDQAVPSAHKVFDEVILCGQNDFLPNESAAANRAALEARSDILLFVEGALAIAADTFDDLVKAVASGRAPAVVVTAGAGCAFACDRKSFLSWLGFDEDSIYAGCGTAIGALCERLTAAGVEVLSLSGPVPDAGLSSTRKDFLKITQQTHSGLRRGGRLLPLQVNERIRVRTLHQNLLQGATVSPSVRSVLGGYRVPRRTAKATIVSSPHIHVSPGQYRVTCTAEADPGSRG